MKQSVTSVSSSQAERNELAGEICTVEAHLNGLADEIRKVEAQIIEEAEATFAWPLHLVVGEISEHIACWKL